MPLKQFDLRQRNRIPLWVFLFWIACVVIPFFAPKDDQLKLTITLVTAVSGFGAFLYAQHSRELILFRELFREFNQRYDHLNDRLNKIYWRPVGQSLEAEDKAILNDYFNLCGEQYMYQSSGCIDPRVWIAWRNGMKWFAGDPEIQDFWKQELATDSYYGLTWEILTS